MQCNRLQGQSKELVNDEWSAVNPLAKPLTLRSKIPAWSCSSIRSTMPQSHLHPDGEIQGAEFVDGKERAVAV